MLIYSALLALTLTLGAPWWLARMALSGRYREGLMGRLGAIPRALGAALAACTPGRDVIWVHAVSVGELFAAERLIAELRRGLPDSQVVLSTTTAAGQAMARQRLTEVPIFYFPLDFAFAMRRYLRVLKPSLVVLMESELWPRLLTECERRGVPVAVVNARVSDRSYPRYLRLGWLWRPLLRKVRLFLAQGEESAERLRRMGAPAGQVSVTGNLKYDVEAPRESARVLGLRALVGERTLLIAGSTLEGEEELLLDAWSEVRRAVPGAMLLLAPRHPQRFGEVRELLRRRDVTVRIASAKEFAQEPLEAGEVIVLDTLGDLAAAYALARAAFVGGSLVAKGGHNPLEAARFAVPVVMGESYENFREIVEGMKREDAIEVIARGGLAGALIRSLVEGRARGERGQRFFRAQAGATRRTVDALRGVLAERP